MVERQPRQAGDRLTADLWLVAAMICAAAFVLLIVTVQLDRVVTLPSWLTVGGAADARAILSALLGAVSTVLALIFPVTLLVLSVAVSQFGPRLLARFMRDRFAQATLGLFLASFLFVIGALVVTKHEGDVRLVPELTLCVAVLLVLVSFAALMVYSLRVALSIQAGNVLARVVHELGRGIRQQAALRRSNPAIAVADGTAPPSAIATRCVEAGLPVAAVASGYVRAIDRNALVAAATPRGAVVRLMFRPGQFVATGDALAHVWPKEQQPALEATVLAGVAIGWHRSLAQDLEFGIAQLVEIAMRALSANDTFTALACIDWLSEALLAFSRLPEGDGVARDAGGKIRLLEPPLRFPRVVKSAFDQIRQSADGNVAITIRLLQAFQRIGPQLKAEDQRAAVLAQVEAIREAVAHRSLARTDSADVVSAFNRAKATLIPR